MKQWIGAVLVGAGLCAFLAGCGGSSVPAGGSGGGAAAGSGSSGAASGSGSGSSSGGTAARTYTICPGPDAQKNALIAFFDAHEGDTIHFCKGQFDFSASLVMTGKRGITIEGEGRDATILSFKNSPAEDGVSINHVTGVTVQNLTIYDAPGNGLRIFRTEYVTVRGVKVGWSVADPASPNYDSSQSSWTHDGSYSFYPVLCHHVLIEDSVSVGSSDAGVYVGQSNDILVRRTEAFHNVAGFEFENTYRAEFIDNVAHDNVGGFLVFDLPGRAQSGEKNLVHHNESYNNNIKSFAPRGAIVGDVPSGTGMLVLASDQLELYDNNIHDNNTSGLFIVNYGLADSSEPSTKYDFYPEGIHVYANTFKDNGGSPQLPDLSRDTCTGMGGLPGKGDSPDCLGNNASLLPLVLVVKNLGKSAQIVWDGATDSPNGCTSYPVDHNGVPLNQADPNDLERYEARSDERGRPNFYIYDPTPKCKYNAWKFDQAGALKLPQNGQCIENSNQFVRTQVGTLLVDNFANVHMHNADITDPSNLVLADHVMPQQCPTLAPQYLAQTTPNLGSFTPNPTDDPRPSDAEIAAACGAVQAGQINYRAVNGYNCPTLDQYGLFRDAQEPRRNPNGFGVPYELNTILFSDYAVKYRIMFLPPDASGRVQKAGYQDHQNCTTLAIFDCYTATLSFPVGTVFAKTFAFRNGASEEVVETRLLIKRRKASGEVYWVGLPYEWTTDSSGKRSAVLKLEGDTKSVSYDYDDPDPAVVDGTGKRQHYGPGSVSAYQIPNAGGCILCHNGDDLEPGSPPIGPKVRNLNRDNAFGNVSMNQLAYLKSQGMVDLPDDPSRLERLPKWNVPGDTGQTANSPADVHQRVRAFLEVNCMHCHNPAGNAQNSGLSLDSFNEPMDEGHGICKPPIAAGIAANVGNYDIQPGTAAQSILAARLASVQPGIRMPPISRTVTQTEAANLVQQWINQDVQQFADPNADKCATSSNPLPLKDQVPYFLRRVKPEDQGKARVAPWG